MNTENLQTLKIHKLTQAQYDRELAAGNIDENALYLTPDEEIDLSPYATIEQVVGEKTEGTSANLTSGSTATCGVGAEIFNDYADRAFDATGYVASGNVASGKYSHAEGHCTTAAGDYCHAEGWRTFADGLYCHAEGQSTTASGLGDHAEGNSTFATGHGGSHAEGQGTRASAPSSHAEGFNTEATEQGAHAEGNFIISGDNSYITTIASGVGSHAEGEGTVAEGEGSHSEGYLTQAIGLGSHAEGRGNISVDGIINRTTASGEGSHAEGNCTTASGYYSHAEGQGTTANIFASHAEGVNTIASGNASHSEGTYTVASGDYSHAEGEHTTASGYISHAEGSYTTASGINSHAAGYYTTADNYQYVVGKYNATRNPIETVDTVYNASDTVSTTYPALFIVGNGTGDTSRSNAFTVYANGKCKGLSSFGSSGADYARQYEWLDGNPNNEDRRGLLVVLDGSKIRIATPDDDIEDCEGVVSTCPAFVENDPDEWHDRYLKDVFGRRITQEVIIPEETITKSVEKIDEETGETVIEEVTEVIPEHTITQFVVNPEYDPEQEYICRDVRPEWTVVGFSGFIVAVDDGTCQVNGYCTVGENGALTMSETRTAYRVMERKDDNHILVRIK